MSPRIVLGLSALATTLAGGYVLDLWRVAAAEEAACQHHVPVVLQLIMDATRQLERLLRKAREDRDILAVILFGSAARGDHTPTSDVDVCLVLQLRKYDSLALSRKKLAYLKQGDLDVHIFQQLPLYIRRRVLKEGKVLFERDTDALYELAFRTAQAFEDFKPIYYTYLAEVVRAGP